MPVVQRYGDPKVAPAALPDVRLVSAETPLSEGAGLAEAQGQQADAEGRLAGTVGAVATEQIQKACENADTVVTMAAGNALAKATSDIQNRALAVKGKDTLALPDSTTAAFNIAADQIQGTLTNDTQKQVFAKTRSQQDVNLYQAVGDHVAREMTSYQASELKSSLDLDENAVAEHALDPDQRVAQEAMQHGIDLIHQQGPLLGWGPQQTTEEAANFKSRGIVARIDRLLVNNYDEEAAHTYEDAKAAGAIQGAAMPGVEQRLESGTTMGTGQRTSDAIWQQLGPKDDSAPINLDAMASAARTQLASNPKALEATLHFLRERKADAEFSRKDREDTSNGTLWTAASQGTSLADLSQMPEFLAAPGKVQAQLSDYVVNHAEHAANRDAILEGRAYTAQQRARADLEQRTWGRYWDLSDPRTLNAMSENQLQALRPEIGDDHVNRLLTQKRTLGKSEDAVRSATIDDDLFKTVAETAGLKAYTAKTDDQKNQLGQLKNAVETAIDQAQQQKGRTITRDEKQTLMQGIVDRQVYLSRWFATDPNVPTAIVHAKDQAQAYVPLANIPKASLTQWLNVLRSESSSAARLTDAQILDLWGQRIQRAHAAHLMGLGADEERKRLFGQ